MWRRLVVVLGGVLVGCGEPSKVDSCRVDTDCAASLICFESLCVTPNDAGTSADAGRADDAGMAGVDAGARVDAGVDAGTDAGMRVDAGPGCVPTSTFELCNGLDDDCDGLVDDLAIVINRDGGTVPFDGGFGAIDGTCTLGLGACARSGTTSCVSGALACSAVSGTAGAEICNGLDDDCDGQTDEASAGLCAAQGQTCSNAACSCPSGQTVCGASCVTLGGACTVGVGVCTRTGTDVCTTGAVACSVSPGTPGTEVCNAMDDDCDGQTDEAGAGLCPAQGQTCSNATCACPSGQTVCNGVCKVLTAEVCDGLDNDCNGQVDEGVTIACLADGDGDAYATSSTTSQQCPAAGRAAFGNCPSGFVSPAASLGTDCNATDAAFNRAIAERADADADGYCSGAATSDCVGANPLPGRRFLSNCNPIDDCNDASASLYRVISSRNDADNDTHCAGTSGSDCVGATALSGRRFTLSCSTDDCDDANAAKDHFEGFRIDADGDSFCIGGGIQLCVGTAVPAGWRRIAQCVGDDCNDGNTAAGATCTIAGGYFTTYRQQTCPNPAGTFAVSTAQFCPAGFSPGTPTAQKSPTSDTAGCTAASLTSITQACDFLAGSTCRVVADCIAN